MSCTRNSIIEVYQGNQVDHDDFTRRIEGFFKACHELGDWIEEDTGLPAKAYAKAPPTLELCDAVAQTAKHHTRRQSGDPITAVVVELFADTGTSTPTSRGRATRTLADGMTRSNWLTDALQSGKSSSNKTASTPTADGAISPQKVRKSIPTRPYSPRYCSASPQVSPKPLSLPLFPNARTAFYRHIEGWLRVR